MLREFLHAAVEPLLTLFHPVGGVDDPENVGDRILDERYADIIGLVHHRDN